MGLPNVPIIPASSPPRPSHSLSRINQRLWQWLGAAPVTLKVFGIVVLPLLAVSAVGILYARHEIVVSFAESEWQIVHFRSYLESIREVALLALGAGGIGLAASMLFTWLLVRPLRDLAQAMSKVQAGDLSPHITVWAPDEIGAVQAAFLAMVEGLRESRAALLEQQAASQQLCLENSRLLAEVRANSERLQQLLRHATNAQEAERKRISRELHDETGQALTSILLRLKVLQDEQDVDVIHDRLNGLRYLTSQTLEEVRRLSMDLRPTALDDLGLAPAVKGYVQQFAERSGIETSFSAPTILARLSPEVEIAVYRAVQEGLTNVMRHADAHHVGVSLAQTPDRISLTITDDGVGMDQDALAGGGLGLAGMRERVMMAGGTLRVATQPGLGTRILIELPLGQGAL